MSEYRIPLGYVRGPAGTAGKNFEFKKTYTSVSAMNADFSGTDTSTGDYVLIAATSADDADNGRLYRKGESTWIYVARINGPTGAQGQRGPMPPLVTDLNVTLPGEGALDASVGPRIAERLVSNGGDAAENMVTFSSSDTDDSSAITGYETMPVFEKGQSGSENRLKTLFATISKAVKNIRYIIKLMGSTDISAIGSGTVTDILSALNSGKFDKANVVNNLTTQNAGYSLDARQGRALSSSISSLNDAFTSLNSDVKNYKTKNYSRIAYYQESFTFRKQGRFVEVSYAGSSVAQTAQSAYVQLFTDALESAYRPLGYVYIMMTPANTSGSGSTVLQIRPDGVVNTYNFNRAVTAGLQYRMNTVYMAADFS